MDKKVLYLMAGTIGTIVVLAGIGIASLYKMFYEKATEEEKAMGFPKYVEKATKDKVEKAREFSKDKVEKAKTALTEQMDNISDAINEAILPDNLTISKNREKKSRTGVQQRT